MHQWKITDSTEIRGVHVLSSRSSSSFQTVSLGQIAPLVSVSLNEIARILPHNNPPQCFFIPPKLLILLFGSRVKPQTSIWHEPFTGHFSIVLNLFCTSSTVITVQSSKRTCCELVADLHYYHIRLYYTIGFQSISSYSANDYILKWILTEPF